MKTPFRNTLIVLFLCSAFSMLQAQMTPLQFFRPNDQRGLSCFETAKEDTVLYTGLKVRVGGNFTQDFQALSHEHTAVPVIVDSIDINKLVNLTDGFNLAMANLNVDAQLADGIRMNLTVYLSSRDHKETWVKGGYIQLDKLPFLKSEAIDHIMQHLTIKAGDYEVDYGDQHFRRSDGSNAIYNPFVENYIMDEFTTEIGGAVYYHSNNGLLAMVGMTNGEMNPTVIKSSKIDSTTGKPYKYPPSIYGKLGYDKQINENLRFRLTGSFYANKSAANNSLFFGDRTGSHYFFVLENTQATSNENAWSGRYDPKFNFQVTTFMINPFLKYRGLEIFGTYESAKGRTATEPAKRTANQFAVDFIYRFPAEKENFWIGGRYNSVIAALPHIPNDITITRLTGSIGWFVTPNIMMKAEYVNQEYKDFPVTDIRSGGKFDGLMVEASVGF